MLQARMLRYVNSGKNNLLADFSNKNTFKCIIGSNVGMLPQFIRQTATEQPMEGSKSRNNSPARDWPSSILATQPPVGNFRVSVNYARNACNCLLSWTYRQVVPSSNNNNNIRNFSCFQPAKAPTTSHYHASAKDLP